MGVEEGPHRSVWGRVLGIIGIVVLSLLIAGVLLTVYALHKRSEARAKPLRTTGADPSERISDLQTYRLRIWGKVGREVSLKLSDVEALPPVTSAAPLECVLDWTDYAVWTGAAIRDVVEAADPLPDAKFLVFHDDRDFSATLDMEYVRTGKPILAYAVNGGPLPREHGWPLRVVAPDKYGYKWVKWVTSIELTDRGYEGTYESSGYSLDGDVSGPKEESEKHAK